MPLLYRRADRVVGVSRGICDELRRTVGGKAIELIHNPVVPDTVATLAAAPVEHPWLQDRAVPVVMGVGRLAPEKDFPGLVRAAAAVGRERPLRLMILGEGPERGRIEATAREVGFAQHLALPGRVDNVLAHLSRAGVFALSLRFEGFGNALVEAMACGTPVVATDCPVGPRRSSITAGSAAWCPARTARPWHGPSPTAWPTASRRRAWTSICAGLP